MREEEILLGKPVGYPEQYSKEILRAIPRSANREVYGIGEQVPFCGFDVWHAYEAGFLLNNGMPVCGVLKIVYPSDSPCLVESKSLKLYLGSFNMVRMGNSTAEGIRLFTETVRNDLGELLSGPAGGGSAAGQVGLRTGRGGRVPYRGESLYVSSDPDSETEGHASHWGESLYVSSGHDSGCKERLAQRKTLPGICFHTREVAHLPFEFSDYHVLEAAVDANTARFSVYREEPGLLAEGIVNHPGEMQVCSHLLRSNCKITNQPDWGSVYIRMKADTGPAPLALLKYIVSLRAENHFHEEICEMVFKRLADIFRPGLLTVCCLYTRRGGIDICPVRSNQREALPSRLTDETLLTQKAFRQ